MSNHCNARNPENLSQICERIGKCRNYRKHQAVIRPKNGGKAELIEFVTPDQEFTEKQVPINIPIQGSLF